MVRFVLLFVISFALNAGALSAQILKVPNGKPIMVDAKISDGEWTDAAKIDLFRGGRLYAKKVGEYLFLAVVFPEGTAMSTDLYIDDGTQPLTNLHASAQLGERVPRNGEWSDDDWKWANNRDWVANVNRIASWQERKFRDENVREYQILRQRFPGAQWRVMLEVHMRQTEEKWTTTPFPAEASNAKPDAKWIVLQLGK
jgi:hypothetical protein